MESSKKPKKTNYRVVMIESSLPHSYSGRVDVNMEDEDTFCFSVYNNPGLYRLLTRAIEKYLS
jgi:hypothetical protein